MIVLINSKMSLKEYMNHFNGGVGSARMANGIS
ncbi:hypothetical protein QOZ91_003434 [Clostridium sardiniense]|nr:hypothetical protein [Clostridium sardiniense]